MVYVFEDSKNSMLSKFFEQSYPTEIVSKFHYTKSNSKMRQYIVDHFDNDDRIAVILDMMPGNQDLRDRYYEIADLVEAYPNIRVFPIMCREYYLLKALKGTKCICNDHWVDTCLKFGFPEDTSPSILQTEEERTYCTTAERFTKLVARKALSQCSRIGRLVPGESGYRPYYTEDCFCTLGSIDIGCVVSSLQEKSNSYVKMFGVFPQGSLITDIIDISWEGTIAARKLLVDAHNGISDRLARSGKCWKDSFEPIAYIHV